MKRVALTIVATTTALVLLLQYKTPPTGAGRPAALAPVSPSSSAGTASVRPHPRRTHGAHHLASPSASPTTAATDSALGATINTRYGPVEVKVTETAGRITDVTAVQLPSQDSHSQSIAAYAAPRLRQEAITANSARINVISGATYTSDGYAQSLQSALDSLNA